jgi:Fe-S cluster assembly ATPase SufC
MRFGHPAYEITGGEALFDGCDISEWASRRA